MAYVGVKPAGITSATEAEIAGDLTVDTSTLKVDSTNNRVGIGEDSPLGTLHVRSGNASLTTVNANADDLILENNGNCGMSICSSTSGQGNINFIDNDDTNVGRIQYTHSENKMQFRVNDSVAATIDSSGNVLVGTTNTDPAFNNVAGQSMAATGQFQVTRDGGTPALINRKSDDGTVLDVRKDGGTVGAIGAVSGDIFICGVDSSHAGIRMHAGNRAVLPVQPDGSFYDNSIDLGQSNCRWDDVYATNGTIQTSDQNEKQQIASLTSAEITAAKAISKLFKTFKWNSSVTENGDAARTHTGVIAQEVQTVMTDAGLDASKYAFWCSDTWWETSTDVPAVEADEEAGIEARDAYTRIDTYKTADEAPEGATQRTRLGIRYPELLAFIGAATEQRLADIETRLTALEDA